MGKIAFITGITGQDGSYLCELLISKGYEVHGIVRRTSLMFTSDRLDPIRNDLHLHYGDLTDGSALNQLFFEITHGREFDVFEIYNLGAQSHVQISFEIPEYTSMVDGIGVLKVLEAIRAFPVEIRNKTRFYQAGTSEMFGNVLETPQTETTPFRPQSPYACAKVYAHYLVRNYRESYAMFACNGILFNHESPRRGANFVTMKIVNGVKSIVSGNWKSIKLGNIYSKRDWGHAKDYVEGMWLMLQQDRPDDYVLATNKTTSVKDFIIQCFRYKGIELSWEGEGLNEKATNVANGEVVVEIDPKYFRPSEVEFLLGNPAKAQEKLGWTIKHDLTSLIEDMFENGM
ncbi:GDP-mannose 4,6-dehydratase [bacterium]|nr:GDP-mannose 4,6-dehydratase [bacterium]